MVVERLPLLQPLQTSMDSCKYMKTPNSNEANEVVIGSKKRKHEYAPLGCVELDVGGAETCGAGAGASDFSELNTIGWW